MAKSLDPDLNSICIWIHDTSWADLPSPSKLSWRTSCTASSVASRLCSTHFSPLSERRMTISRSLPRSEAKWGTCAHAHVVEALNRVVFHRVTRDTLDGLLVVCPSTFDIQSDNGTNIPRNKFIEKNRKNIQTLFNANISWINQTGPFYTV